MAETTPTGSDAELDALLVSGRRLVVQARRFDPAGGRRRLRAGELRQATALAEELAALLATLLRRRETTGQKLSASQATVSASLAYLTTGRLTSAR